MMTKKHFKEIANILKINIRQKNMLNESFSYFDNQIYEDLTNYFKSINPNFDEDKFRKAALS